MDRGVQAPVVGRVADRAQQLVGERLLALERIVAREDASVLPRRGGRGDERDELPLQRLEQRRDLGGRQAGLVVVEQDVVGMREVARAVEAGDVALLELEDPLERGREVAEVGAVARLEPLLLRERVARRHLRRELGRHADRPCESPCARMRWSATSSLSGSSLAAHGSSFSSSFASAGSVSLLCWMRSIASN